MKELLRIENGKVEGYLNHYCLTVYEGDILYIQSLSEKNLRVLQDVLSGEMPLESGKIYLSEKINENYNTEIALEYGIYTVTFGREFVDYMSIAENLKQIRPMHCIYSKSKNNREISEYLKKENFLLDEQMPVWNLSDGERKKLGVLRAKLFGAKFVILDLNRTHLEGRIANEICQLILRLREEGITFLILSSHYTEISRIATRIQYFFKGQDVKEWCDLTGEQKEMLANGELFFSHDKKTHQKDTHLFTGIYDYEWEMTSGVWKFLSYVKENNSDVWENYIGVDIPAEGMVYENDTVIVPRDGADMLLDNLSIGDNLTILAGKRIATGKYGKIHKKYQKILEKDFYRKLQIPDSVKKPGELTRLQRKILFVSRFELLHPKVIILESPYGDLSWEDTLTFETYLQQLDRDGIRIIYIAQAADQMIHDCCCIIQVKRGKHAKITTF